MSDLLDVASGILAARMATCTAHPICWPNTPPLTSSNAPWVRFTVLPGELQKPYIGPQQDHDLWGYVSAQVFAPSGGGDGVARRAAWSIGELFRRYESGGLWCGLPEYRAVGDNEGFYQINVLVPWTITGTV